ncbi:MAG: PAS domain S-box protein [Pseudomonadales bacterium]
MSDHQLAIALSIVLWTTVSAGALIISFFVKRFIYTSLISVMLTGAGLAICFSLAATSVLLYLSFFSTVLLISIGFYGLFLAGSHRHFQLNVSEEEPVVVPVKRILPADFPSDALLPFLLDDTNCGLYVFDNVSKTNIYINAQFAKITGYNLKALNALLKKSGPLSHIHPNDAENVERHMISVMASAPGKSFDLQYRYRHRAGHWVNCVSRDTVINDVKGRPRFFIGSFINVSQLQEERAEVDHLSARYTAAFEDVPVGMAHVSFQGKILRANRTLKTLLGYTDNELANLAFMDITHPEDLLKDLDQLKSLARGDIQQYKVDKRYFNAQNQIIWVELTVADVRKVDGDVDYFIGIVRDITHDRLVARELNEANAAFKRFANSSPFLLEQPIEAIGAMASRIENKIVQRGIDGELLFIQDVAAISKVSSELSNRLNNLIDLVKFNPNLMSMEYESIEEIIKLSRNQTGFNPNYPRCRVSSDSNISIPVDKYSFVKLIVNLCLNIEQMRHLPDSQLREIKIGCFPEDWHERVILELHCSGFELTPEFRQLMLRAYNYQDDNQLDEVGLRFAIIRQIVRAHNGLLEVDCEADNGFSLTIILPTGTELLE